MRKTVILSCVLIICLCVFSSCSKTDGIITDKTNADNQSEITENSDMSAELPVNKGGEYIIKSIDFANEKITECDFDSVKPEKQNSSSFADCEVYIDGSGNMKTVGYDESGKSVFESYSIIENGKQLIYAEYKNGDISALVIEEKQGRVDFTFEDGVCVEYTLTENLAYKSSVEAAFRITHYDANGYKNTVYCDMNGKIIEK